MGPRWVLCLEQGVVAWLEAPGNTKVATGLSGRNLLSKKKELVHFTLAVKVE